APAPGVSAMSREGLRLRFRLGHAGGDPDAPTVLVYAGGRVEHWRAADGAWEGERLRWREVGAEAVAQATALARQVVVMTPPRLLREHDPTRALTIEVFGERVARSQRFLWGRASRNDTPLDPVEGGEQAAATFNALLAALGPFAAR
ncbi:MAG TPA: hypothetical protein VFS00_29310, partial [Polyangiaceae bacterium]|nr:hypothetical protein [Polyangiaceae bacterium]